jgi:chorismate mutase
MSFKENTMSHSYLVVSTDVLPEVFIKVIEAKSLIMQKKVKGVSEAVKKVGISRSSYYKYIDHVFTFEDKMSTSMLTLTMVLAHEKGVLSRILEMIATANGNVLTITQSPPESGIANVHVTFDTTQMTLPIDEFIAMIHRLSGVVELHVKSGQQE